MVLLLAILPFLTSTGPNNGYITTAANKVMYLLEEYGLTQHVKEPTHAQGNTKDIIDLVLINRPDLIKKLSEVDGIADHSTAIIYANISPKHKHRPMCSRHR